MKRIDIARALAAKPEVLLLDEPFAHIDFETRAKVMRAISDYMARNATILLVVTHEDFDLRWFVEKSFDFPELVAAGRGPDRPSQQAPGAGGSRGPAPPAEREVPGRGLLAHRAESPLAVYSGRGMPSC